MTSERNDHQAKPTMGANINTWITLAGFALTLVVNAMSYQAFKTETEVWRKAFAEELRETKEERATDLMRVNTRIEAVERVANAQEVAAATASAQLTAVRESLAELKSAQAETNRLLRDVLSNGSKP